MQLAYAGNHCQGTKFLDGKHLITPQLEQRFDAISKLIPDFYFGRYDIRFSDVRKLKQGKGFKIIELNGVTSESTNIYDPAFRLREVYQILFRQWGWLFRIGKANIERGACQNWAPSNYPSPHSVLLLARREKASAPC